VEKAGLGLAASLILIVQPHFFFRPQGFYLTRAAEVCWFFSVLEEKVGDWLSFKVSASAPTTGVWECARTRSHQNGCKRETVEQMLSKQENEVN